MPNKLIIIQAGESLPFSFDRGGASIVGWTCQIKAKQKPDETSFIDRFIISDNDFVFKGSLTPNDTLSLAPGSWYLIAVLNKAETDEQREIPVRFQVSKSNRITSIVAPIVFSPQAGIIVETDLITLSTTTPEAVIRFTLDGSEPTENSAIFLAPFSLPFGSQTVKAIGTRLGFQNSVIGTAIYNVFQGVVADVTFFPPSGDIAEAVLIDLTTITPGATIHFTTDGSDPTILSPIFTVPFMLPLGPTTVKAFAVKEFFIDSNITFAAYDVLAKVADVTFSPVAGAILNTDPITLSSVTPGAVIHFTTDGSAPTAASPVFLSPFTLGVGVKTVRAFALQGGLIDSNETQAIYTVSQLMVQPVTFLPVAGTILNTDPISLATVTSGATIHFTTDGSVPTVGSPIFTIPFTLPVGVQTVRAFAVKVDFSDSIETQAIYTVDQLMVQPVTFLPVAGIISDVETISLSTITSGATIHFTTDGSTPTTGSPVFSVPFTLPLGVQTVKAFAVKVDFSDSIETQAIYDVQAIVEPVTFAPPAGTIPDVQTITLSTVTPTATIHFTTDGSPPTAGSPIFTVPFLLPIGNQTVRAFALKAGLIDSIETQAIYTVQDVVEPVTFSPVAGSILDNTPITLSTITFAATIHFTVDGSTPNTGSPVFTAPFTLPVGSQTVKAFAVRLGFFDSIETQAAYTVTAAFSPLNISNIVFWVDANDVSSITLNGGNVQTWGDQSSNNNDLQQLTSSKQPFYNTTATPHFVVFDGIADSMAQLNPGTNSQPNTFFLVARAVVNGTIPIFDSNSFFANFLGESTPPGVWVMFAGSAVSTGKTLNTNKNILTPIFNVVSSKFYVNGGSSNLFVVGGQTANGFILGSNFADSAFANYEFYDVLFYDKLLTVSELNDLGVFFAAKHSLTWTTITV